MNFHLEYEQESGGRWLAEVPEIPGVLAYGVTANQAMAKAEILALRVLAERIETEESLPFQLILSLLRWHESLAFEKSSTCFGCITNYWLEN